MASIQEYLKVFETHEEYEEYITGDTMVTPNVSYCEDMEDLHYNPYESILVATFNVEDSSEPTSLYFYRNSAEAQSIGENMFSKIKIDGEEVAIWRIDQTNGTYPLTNGVHTVEYSLLNPTKIGIDEEAHEINAIFMNCDRLVNVVIPDTVIDIYGFAFSLCENLTSVTIPSNVTNIGEEAFSNCWALTSVELPNSLTNIGEGAFAICSALTSIEIPTSVTNIDESAFEECVNITDIEIPNGITIIKDSTFNGCNSATSVTIPNSVINIGNYAFSWCNNLTSVTIPSSVTSIGDNAFDECEVLTNITSLPTTPPTLGNEYSLSLQVVEVIYVPSESVEAYKAATNWSTYANQIQAIPTT